MKLLIPSHIRKAITKHMFLAGRKEIGGILMAEEISSQCFRIVDFSVDTSNGTISSFVRNSINHEQKLSDFFLRTGADYSRFNYLGEWHTHPSFSVRPSQQDINSMQDLVDNSCGVSFAVMLIAKLMYIYSFKSCAFLFVRGTSPIEIEVIYEKRSFKMNPNN